MTHKRSIRDVPCQTGDWVRVWPDAPSWPPSWRGRAGQILSIRDDRLYFWLVMPDDPRTTGTDGREVEPWFNPEDPT
jgi:hypothetical protein